MATMTPVYTALDNFSRVIEWGPGNSGDVGAPVQAWAWTIMSWQLTGQAQDANINNPDINPMSDRAVEIHGSNDGTCFGLIFTLAANPSGMNDRLFDPVRDGSADQRFVWLKPVWTGSVNPAGADCSLLLFNARMFGPRTD